MQSKGPTNPLSPSSFPVAIGGGLVAGMASLLLYHHSSAYIYIFFRISTHLVFLFCFRRCGPLLSVREHHIFLHSCTQPSPSQALTIPTQPNPNRTKPNQLKKGQLDVVLLFLVTSSDSLMLTVVLTLSLPLGLLLLGWVSPGGGHDRERGHGGGQWEGIRRRIAGEYLFFFKC